MAQLRSATSRTWWLIVVVVFALSILVPLFCIARSAGHQAQTLARIHGLTSANAQLRMFTHYRSSDAFVAGPGAPTASLWFHVRHKVTALEVELRDATLPQFIDEVNRLGVKKVVLRRPNITSANVETLLDLETTELTLCEATISAPNTDRLRSHLAAKLSIEDKCTDWLDSAPPSYNEDTTTHDDEQGIPLVEK